MDVRRSITAKLREWKSSPRRKPLLIRGARQTGKTWIVTAFGDACYERTLRVDFMRDRAARRFFQGRLDPHAILADLSLYTGVPVEAGSTLIFLDEIQECPEAMTALKYFCEQAPEQHVIATGSYMGVSKHPDASFPVGKVTMLTLHPLSFSEFLTGSGREGLAELIDAGRFGDVNTAFSDVLEPALREYMVVGGMPEAASAFLDGASLDEVRDIQHDILDTYDLDFSKHAPSRLVDRMRLAWAALPAQLAKENRRFVYGAVRPGARARDFEESLAWLRDYGVVSQVPCVDALRIPLSGYEKVSAFKLFASDIGLLGALAGLPVSAVTEGSRLFTEFKGALTEQYVCQQLVTQGYSPVYWANPRGQAETDFVIQQGMDVIPIEVKAELNLKSKSLRYVYDHFRLRHALRFSMAGYREQGWVTNIPLWAAGGTRAYLDASHPEWA